MAKDIKAPKDFKEGKLAAAEEWGAKACPNCGENPIAMLKTPSYYDNVRGVEVPPVYEVGCGYCLPYYIEHETGEERMLDGKKAKVRRRSYSARATTPVGAVENWNAGKMVEDTRFGINTSPDEEKRLG
jgi:hypothetical protein